VFTLAFRAPLRRAGRFGLAVTIAATSFLVLTLARTAPASAATSGPPYWIANPQGDVWNFGSAADYGDIGGKRLNKPIVGIAPTATAKGYWLVATDGGIFAYGDAPFYGSTGNIRLNKPIVGMTPTAGNKGYWMVASDGGIFAYGDAQFYGSTGSIRLNKPVVGMASTPSGHGYWLVASDGGIFAYGDAQFYGSTGSIRLNKPIVSMASTPSGHGYWLVASDGGIFAYGDAKFYGSPGGGSTESYARILSTSDGKGYWLVRNGGDAIAYGTASNSTSATTASTRPAIGLIHDITGPGDLALEKALAQIGKPYVWGAAGPDAFDCSGLMQAAWLSGGITLPRVAADQYNAGRRVALDQLLPGDIVFWATNVADATTIYHDAMYIGAGNVVMAPKTGDFVRIASIWSDGLMPFGVRPRG